MSAWTYEVKPEDKGRAIKDILRREFTFSARMMVKFKKNNCILLNRKPVFVNIIPVTGDIISIVLPNEKSEFPPEDVPIIPVFEDDNILIINKPAGYVVHPTKGHPTRTIANGLTRYMEKSGTFFKIRFVNRLDMDTSGLLLIAKNAFCQDAIVKQAKENKVVKKYLAVTRGVLEEDELTIDAPINRLDPDKPAREVTPLGYPSITLCSTLERYPTGFSLVELSLKTGRTHQIRVHLSYIGHPIVGDHLYGGENVLLTERQALHAHFISFFHPITKTPIAVSVDMPDDMKQLINKIR